MNFKRLLQFAAWPTAAGVIIALLAMLVFPQLRGQQPINTMPNNAISGPYSYADAVSRAAPAVVNIYTAKKVLERDPRYYNNPYFRQLFNNSNVPLQERMQRTLGSGVIVDSSGLILTNNHVINGADKIQVLLNDGRYTSAELVGIDSENDLAVLKITLENLLPISLGQPNNLRVGDIALAIGNPFGVGQSVSQGIVSALGRWGLGINSRENFIQTDAAINPGNSGGALIDARGNLIGINTAILDETGAASVGISFAVPADIAMNSLKQIAEFGEVQRGWLGFTAAPLNDKGIKLFGTLGLIVTGVEDGSPAESAGLVREDVIIKVNDISLGEGVFPERNYHAVQNLVGNLKPGSTITLKVLRAGKTQDIKAVAGIRPTQTKT
ncbi:2-alkenal reductase [Cellvibrio zantedeschiae]|uniref:2-alkenal reductase n=1 Tax=Cellvibrio zantedeschiae TaxID=1237077 RepID=A0ABQ3ASH0_9GAMM|nr:trypsin-like peptidase domain-containing protein [Cellvibrio zantedeschiae]GGY63971.1 2-alkenal reductase [Cellvibrio zantedeschiae]